jgi:uncharacterized iron-regulated protein
MKISALMTTAFLGLLLQGCTSIPSAKAPDAPATFYDTTVRNHQQAPVPLSRLADELTSADVVVIGEFHGHQGAHLLQARLQAELHQRRPGQVLAMEAFNTDAQVAVDRYLADKLGEDELIEDANAWENYRGSYRPLVEYARRHGLPVIAANAPSEAVRCTGRAGAAYVESLPGDRRQGLPTEPFPQVPGYRERFFETLGGGHGDHATEKRQRLENTYLAQLLRDSTMAEQILKARHDYPGHQVLMITGTFHSEQRQGLVAILEHRAPELEVRVLTPFMDEGQDHPEVVRGDYWYRLWPLPTRYRDENREREQMMEQFRNRPTPDCS